MKPKERYVNREISWLYFNERVLQEAANPDVPLIERLKFLGIVSSNLDEFYRVRVGTLTRMQQAGINPKALLGDSPKKILRKIQEIALQHRDDFDRIFKGVVKELENEQIFIINEKELSPEQADFVRNYFLQKVRPRLVPIMLSPERPFPYMKNQLIYLAIYLKDVENDGKAQYALIELPADSLERFVVLPNAGDKQCVIMLDDVIRYGLNDIFAIFNFDRIEAYTIKLTRDAEIDIEEDVTKSFFEKVSKSIKQRQKGQPVRFVYDNEMPDDLLEYILKHNDLNEFESIIPGGRYHNARDFMHFPTIGTKSLFYKDDKFMTHEHLDARSGIISSIQSRDILLHFPYHTFYHIIDLLREAAIDPAVVSIKMTVYRVAAHSNVMNTLINACRNGKQVTVLIELQARFDEEANIYWTKKLEAEGARIVDGVPGLKVHAKLCLITRIEDKKHVHYASIGTGNFNESTARVYSDHSLLTSKQEITREVAHIFDFFDHNYKTYQYRHLLVAPFVLRKKMIKYIKNEMRIAKNGGDAYIYLKLNSLVDREMIDKLYQASSAGVKIRMIVRGICSLIPEVKGLSENIKIVSIVDKYLEHSRIFIFGNGGKERFFLSSADWMIRNLDNRIEVAVPIYDQHIQQELKSYLEIQFKDNVKARIIDKKQENKYRRTEENDIPIRAQHKIYNFLKDKHTELKQG